MPSSDRLTSTARDHGKALINTGADRLTSAVRGRKKSLLYAGAALALAGAGTASAATVAGSASTPAHATEAEAGVPRAAAQAAPAGQHNTPHVVAANQPTAKVAVNRDPVTRHPAAAPAVTSHAATRPTPAPRAATRHSPAAHTAVRHTPAPHAAAHSAAPHTAAPKPVTQHTAAPHAVPRRTATRHEMPHATARLTRSRQAGVHTAGAKDGGAVTWRQVSNKLNVETNPQAAAHHQVPLADQLTPVGTTGGQSWMPLNQAQVANASTIVQQALAKKMGIRSAVIAVATAMQESQLVNVSYGTGNSLGLFQQQWNMGWGTAAQLMNPRYAADAFLTALQQYQASNPGWAAQPLWQAAQGVQKSAFPYAYAKWEAQAASLVKQVATHLGPATA